MPFIDHIKKILRFFQGVKCAAITITALIIIYFLGLLLPQKWMFDTRIEYDEWISSAWYNGALDFIGFTDIYLSPLTIFFLTVFFVNLLLVTLKRVPLILKRAYLTGGPAQFSAEEMKSGKDLHVLQARYDMDSAIAKIKSFFEGRRYKLMEAGRENAFVAIRNRLSPIGFIFFHFSFFLLLAGSLLIMYTRFAGNLALTGRV